MVWTSPMTAVDNSAMTASLYNAQIRDNLRAMAPFLASGAGQIFVTTGANALAARTVHYDEVATSQTTTSSSYTDLSTPGPSVTVGAIYGQQAMVFTSCELNQNGADLQASAAVEVSGASSYPAVDTRCAITRDGMVASNAIQMMGCYLYDPLSRDGTITFTMKYRNGGSGTVTFAKRRILVLAL
jgi:hypothetical protein